MEPILCTQPRRFAVVAVAKMVAKGRNCELGGEVGYHIGHSKHLSERSFVFNFLTYTMYPLELETFIFLLVACLSSFPLSPETLAFYKMMVKLLPRQDTWL